MDHIMVNADMKQLQTVWESNPIMLCKPCMGHEGLYRALQRAPSPPQPQHTILQKTPNHECMFFIKSTRKLSPPAAGDLLPEALGLVRHAAVLLLAGLDHHPPVLLKLGGRHGPQGAREVSQEGLNPVVQVLGPVQACTGCWGGPRVPYTVTGILAQSLA